MREKATRQGVKRANIATQLPAPPAWDTLCNQLSSETPIYQEGSLSLYILRKELTQHSKSPIMQAIGYEREVAFRLAGGGTGKPYDVDMWDTHGYEQIICVDAETKRVVGGYRFARGTMLHTLPKGSRGAVEHLFQLSSQFAQKVLPASIELGRSFIDATSEKSGRILDILWYGLGYLITKEDWKFFMGKVTFYPTTLQDGVLDTLHNFLMLNFPPNQVGQTNERTAPRAEFAYTPKPLPSHIMHMIDPKQQAGKTFEERRKNLFRIFSRKRQPLRPFMLLFKYLSVGGSKVQFFGSAVNPNFGNVVEIFFILPVNTDNRIKMQRYITPIIQN